MRRLFIPLAICTALLAAQSCKRELGREENQEGNNMENTDRIVRKLVDHSFTPALEGQTKLSISEVSDGGSGIKLSPAWNAEGEERISVYILKDNGAFYAGDMVSDEAGADGKRTFHGQILAKAEGERYAYVYPSLSSKEQQITEGTAPAAQGTIDWSSQDGTLEGLGNIMPFVWKESQEDNSIVSLENTAYVVKLVMNFQEEAPNTLGSNDKILLSTMKRGANDKVFPKEFKAANLWMVNNSGFANPTEGTNNSDSDYLTELQLTSWADGGNEGKTKVAYVLCSSAHNLNVFSSKFRITANVGENTFYSEFRSFPGQDEPDAQESKQLEAFTNGKIYRATRNMSLVPPATVISTAFGVSSLLGTWNEYGKPYDPDQRIIAADGMTESNVPSQLFELLGTSDKQAEFTGKMQLDYTPSRGNNTPNFLGKLFKSPGNSTNAGKTMKITKDSKVYVTFISENAWDRNLLGYYFFPYQTSDEVSQPKNTNFKKYIVFPDVSRGDHVPFNYGGSKTGGYDIGTPPNIGDPTKAPIAEYSTIQLLYTNSEGFTSEIFPANTFIGFFVMKDAIKNNAGSLLNWGASKLFTNYGLGDLNPAVNPFAAGDIVSTSESSYLHENRTPGLAIFGFRDNANDNNNYAFATMIYMVSTSDQDALDMQNTAAFNIGATNGSNQVVGRTGSHVITKDLSSGITCSNPDNDVDGSTINYNTTLSIDDPLYGSFDGAPVVMHGDTQINPDSSDGTSYTYTINNVTHDISISAKTTRIVKVKALKDTELNALTTTSESSVKDTLILHCTNSNYTSNPSDGAFNFNGDGQKSTVPFSKSPFWAFDTQIRNSDTALDINPLGKYGKMFWTLEKKEGGFVLKNTFGNYLWRSTETVSIYPLVSTTQESASATLLTAENAGNSGYDIFLKAKKESSLNYMTSRVGAAEYGETPKPIFNTHNSHVDTYGKWRVYKVWTEPRPQELE
ncbi:MAG: hypothetical protein MJY92_01305 [Bacteroidales bacterium]|nr:hypothetical protein [Bacteroidales bacterium]